MFLNVTKHSIYNARPSNEKTTISHLFVFVYRSKNQIHILFVLHIYIRISNTRAIYITIQRVSHTFRDIIVIWDEKNYSFLENDFDRFSAEHGIFQNSVIFFLFYICDLII